MTAYENEAQIKAAFECIMGLSPRAADIQMIQALGATPEVVAEYVWDHWMGEPDEPTEERLLECLTNNDKLIRGQLIQTLDLTIRVRTNMTTDELTALIEGIQISVREFGKEHLDVPRYKEVELIVLDQHSIRLVSEPLPLKQGDQNESM